jgi:hypothetical protein
MVFIFACNTENSTKTTLISNTVDSNQTNSTQSIETTIEEDLLTNEDLTEQLKPIKENVKRISSISNWTSIETKELWETTEGGEAKYYYKNKHLEKIITRHYGETFQLFTEYYLLNGHLSFVFEKLSNYNRPIYYDSISMMENDDKEMFDFDKSEIIEDRYYFEKSKLLHKINNQESSSPLTKDQLLEDQKRILSYFEKLLEVNK